MFNEKVKKNVNLDPLHKGMNEQITCLKCSNTMTSDTSITLHLHRHNTGCYYLGPADITEQLVSVQNSVMVP